MSRRWGGAAPLTSTPQPERAFFDAVHHRVENFIAGILLPHQKKTPDDPYIPEPTRPEYWPA